MNISLRIILESYERRCRNVRDSEWLNQYGRRQNKFTSEFHKYRRLYLGCGRRYGITLYPPWRSMQPKLYGNSKKRRNLKIDHGSISHGQKYIRYTKGLQQYN